MKHRLANGAIRLAVFSAAAMLVSLAGCGSGDRAQVTGQLLRKDGTPLAGARIIARSNDTGKSAYSQTDGEGRFALGVAEEGDGIPPGNYYVTIVEDLGEEDDRRLPSIASKYRDPSSSGLSLIVKDGESTVFNQTLDPR